ncbi:MAG: hypothetical protein KC503_34435, partial [Myxococcales bacterium]|nr:hypothetical protein [Myxococcales bacterium]
MSDDDKLQKLRNSLGVGASRRTLRGHESPSGGPRRGGAASANDDETEPGGLQARDTAVEPQTLIDELPSETTQVDAKIPDGLRDDDDDGRSGPFIDEKTRRVALNSAEADAVAGSIEAKPPKPPPRARPPFGTLPKPSNKRRDATQPGTGIGESADLDETDVNTAQRFDAGMDPPMEGLVASGQIGGDDDEAEEPSLTGGEWRDESSVDFNLDEEDISFVEKDAPADGAEDLEARTIRDATSGAKKAPPPPAIPAPPSQKLTDIGKMTQPLGSMAMSGRPPTARVPGAPKSPPPAAPPKPAAAGAT